jgi:uncharacterized protein (DUF1330 family)
LAAYAKLAGLALEAGGGKVLARGVPAKVYDAGISERAVLIEFPSVEKAIFGSANSTAPASTGGLVERDVRIIRGP